MLTRFASLAGPGALLAAIGLAFLSWLASGAEGRVRLQASVLERSRGRDLGAIAVDKDCNTLSNVPPCVNVGVPCTDCSTSKYRALDTGTVGGSIPGAGTATCGFLQEGVCDWRQECVNKVPTVRACTAPPPPPLEQEEKGDIGVGD